MTLEERFWSKVDKSGDCWIWTGAKISGYPIFRVGNKLIRGHRYSWELCNGKIPEGLFACHHCDNPSCVRPDHIFLGTHTDNMRDARQKGRLKTLFLTEKDVWNIRLDYRPHRVTAKQLSEKYDVSVGAIYNIVK